MKKISQYIVEKFKISKDIKQDKYTYALEKIFNLLGFDIDDEYFKEIKDIIYSWLKENDIYDVYSFAYKEDLESLGVPKEIQKEFDYLDDDKAMNGYWQLIEDEGKALFDNVNSHMRIKANKVALRYKDIAEMKHTIIFVKKDENN